MNDFDFEELDKAVSNLADQTKREHGDSQPVSISPAATSKPADEPRTPQKPAAGASSPQIAQSHRQARLPNARPGQTRRAFMDIVPPSSRKPIQRAIQPISKPEDVLPKEESVATPASAKPLAVRPAKQEPVDLTPPKPLFEESGDIAWPDPLDFHDGTPTEKPGTDTPNHDAKSEAPRAFGAPTADPNDATPFISEAKVEKRPLGAYSNFKAPDQPSPPEEHQDPQPARLLAPEDADSSKGPTPPPAEAKEKEIEKEPEAPSASESSDNTAAKPDLHKTAMMSIPQQYHTEDKGIDKATRPIFDTKEYHPPLVEQALPEHGGRSMWSKLFIMLIVIALLAAAGYFVYVYIVQK